MAKHTEDRKMKIINHTVIHSAVDQSALAMAEAIIQGREFVRIWIWA
jgi:hypothetical protein